MLKIKDNVDLKELEKFEFEKAIDCSYIPFRELDYIFYRPKYSLQLITINKETKLVYLNDNNNYDGLDKLYDLIKADLVEKVGDK